MIKVIASSIFKTVKRKSCFSIRIRIRKLIDWKYLRGNKTLYDLRILQNNSISSSSSFFPLSYITIDISYQSQNPKIPRQIRICFDLIFRFFLPPNNGRKGGSFSFNPHIHVPVPPFSGFYLSPTLALPTVWFGDEKRKKRGKDL